GEGTDPADFNVAHDYIINDMLREELQVTAVPAGGLDWPGARLLSAEKILGEMQRDPRRRPSGAWDSLLAGGPQRPVRCVGGWGRAGMPGDALDGSREREWFPRATAAQQQDGAGGVREQAARAMSLQALMESMKGRGAEAGGAQNTVAALRGLYRPPW